MEIKVIYHSQSGNTKKIAEAIAEAVHVEAIPVFDIADPSAVTADLLFVGDGMYFGGMSGSMKKFLAGLDPSKIHQAAIFCTSGGSWPMGPAGFKRRLKKKGIPVQAKSYKCHGNAFGILFSSHPDDRDKECAVGYALNTLKNCPGV